MGISAPDFTLELFGGFGVDWYPVGPDQWGEGRQVGWVIPNPKPPEGTQNGRRNEVDLGEQIVAVYDPNKLVFGTLDGAGRIGRSGRVCRFVKTRKPLVERQVEEPVFSKAIALIFFLFTDIVTLKSSIISSVKQSREDD